MRTLAAREPAPFALFELLDADALLNDELEPDAEADGTALGTFVVVEVGEAEPLVMMLLAVSNLEFVRDRWSLPVASTLTRMS